ncbi:gonadotropin subunit beta-1-like [Melanotaenia boesemani]|uniref:gonadotropin subunit beta-1-like n=1 Tax=Melanotaenia boesemani TaxID=1250792 RepID=UPI001C055D50|nr:gonadotropin subunit beta-1-like [Melanotaenia boesemani]XP_041842537.1 gonadotropin subunit beta-1-like [Melanotaenia boesemani]
MQLVVMAAVLALVGQGCCGCHPKDFSIYMDVCGNEKCIQTTICEGDCFQEDPSYISNVESSVEKVCSGDWVYEVKYIDGCPVSVPVAKNCKCAECKPNHTYCGRLSTDISYCSPYKK